MPPTAEDQGTSTSTTCNANQVEKTAESAAAALVAKGYKQGVALTKIGNSFPQNAARDLYCAYPGYGRVVDNLSESILTTLSKVLKAKNIKGNIHRRLPDEQFDMVQEFQDVLHEGLAADLDTKRGLRHKKRVNAQTKVVVEQNFNSPPIAQSSATSSAGSWNLKTITPRNPIAARLIAAKNIERPQVKFQIPVDNSASTPFMPKLKDKPNSLKPLAILPEYDESGNISAYLHPYEFELMKFEPSAAQLARKTPQIPPPLADTELVYVDTVPKLRATLAELRQHREIAIDVEHHSYRTFMGITCLVQMSTREKDYIFDTLALREDMHILNEVLTDSKIVKILHGADLDVEWLQRDLSLYIVNMLDTHKAAKALNMARVSLSFLLKHYMNIEADKTFQLADWRMRPLPEELIAYARQDTHYLIYIYERMTNELLDLDHENTNTLLVAYQRSTDVCKKRYTKPKINDTSYLDVMRKSNRIFDNRQLSALRNLFEWRDRTARQEDESYGYVLPNHMMLQIAESLPREMQGILACCNPIPPPVRQQLHALHQIILRARDQPLVKPILETKAIRTSNVDQKFYTNKLYCPHDLIHMEDLRDDLPTLLNLDNSEEAPKENRQPKLYPKRGTLFSTMPQDMEEERRQLLKDESRTLRMPYKRYMAMLPLLEEEKRAETLRIHNEMKKRQLCPSAPLPIVKLEDDEPVSNADNDDNLHNLSLREQLKRKYQQTTTKTNNEKSKIPKRLKSETPQRTPIDDKLNFNNSPTCSMNTSQQAPNTSTDTVIEFAVSDAEDAPPKEIPFGNKPPASNQNTKQKKYNKNKKFKAKARLHAQSSSRSINLPAGHGPAVSNFDYKKVDFKKFQGGAQRARGTEIKPQFHGKSHPNKAQNKQFNKLFTFSNVKSKK